MDETSMENMIARALAAALAPLVSKIEAVEVHQAKSEMPLAEGPGEGAMVVEGSAEQPPQTRPPPPARLNVNRSDPYNAGDVKG